MSFFGTMIVFMFVLGVVAVVAYAVFELSPFAQHVDRYRDPLTDKRRFESPHLETRDEFEHRVGPTG